MRGHQQIDKPANAVIAQIQACEQPTADHGALCLEVCERGPEIVDAPPWEPQRITLKH